MLLNFLLNLKNGPIEESLLILLFSVVSIFLAFPIHEFAHALSAYLLGDKTAKYQGRLTLNPLVHLDWHGFLCLVILGFGWAKPVQFDPRNFKNRRLGTALTAAAGPLSNLIFALIAFAVAAMMEPADFVQAMTFSTAQGWIQTFFVMLGSYNIMFALFNLIPVPPMDGSKLVGEALPLKYRIKYYNLEQYHYFLVLAIIVIINTTDYFDVALRWLSDTFFGFWYPLIGGLLA